jgi:anti-sigma regulatory factor (Ser/Thr protein kinase)
MTLLTLPSFDTGAAEIMCWRRDYPGQAVQARELRRFVGCLLAGFPGLEEVVAAAAEMFGNAVRHSYSGLPGGKVTAEVRRWPGYYVTLALTDQGGPNEPRSCPLTDDAESGRGLAILSAVTTCWSWHGDARARTVTAIFLG